MYTISCEPSVILYVAENKTLAGREDRVYEGEAQGRKLALVLFEAMPGAAGLVRRVHRGGSGMQQVLLTIAEILQTLTPGALPADPERSPAQTELLLEERYEHVEILRFQCNVEPAAAESHVYRLGDEVNAEIALAREVPADQRTKMVIARCLQRNAMLAPGETLQTIWGQTLAVLAARAAPLLPAAPAGPVDPAPGGRGRGRGRGPAVGPAAPAMRGRGRGRA